ncbi:hypothetical protein [Thermodesulfovibrio sp.]|uniref:hypothetical protein n=1 Tax=Thermodesulfovibrio sp. TaxID=2067987 RepID=UPI0030A12284
MEIIYISILFFTFLSGESKNLKFSSYSLIPHSLLISISIFVLAYLNNISSLYLIAVLDLIVRAFLMPYLLIVLLRNRLTEETTPSIIHPLSIALSIVILSVGYKSINTFQSLIFPDVLSCFSAGVMLFVYGMFLLLSKKDIIKMIISFFVIENGIHFLMISMIPHMPKFIELALTVNFVIAIFLFIYITRKLSEITVLEEIKKFRNSKSILKIQE